MKFTLYLLICLVLLTGCGSQIYTCNSIKTVIDGKSQFDSINCKYVLKVIRPTGYMNSYYELILPNNFGEVGYTITFTNGIQAWE